MQFNSHSWLLVVLFSCLMQSFIYPACSNICDCLSEIFCKARRQTQCLLEHDVQKSVWFSKMGIHKSLYVGPGHLDLHHIIRL